MTPSLHTPVHDRQRKPMNTFPSRKSRIAAIGLVGASTLAGVAISGISPASAQSTSAPTAAKTARTDGHAADLAALAGRLGVTTEKIQKAMTDQAKADVDKAVAAGTITAAQGATIKTGIDQGIGGRFRLKAPHRATSSATPPTAAERQAEHSAREADLAARIGVTADQLKQARTAQAKANIDAQVTAGRLTTEQAATLKTAIDQGLQGGRGPGGHGGHGGPGGHGGRGGR